MVLNELWYICRSISTSCEWLLLIFHQLSCCVLRRLRPSWCRLLKWQVSRPHAFFFFFSSVKGRGPGLWFDRPVFCFCSCVAPFSDKSFFHFVPVQGPTHRFCFGFPLTSLESTLAQSHHVATQISLLPKARLTKTYSAQKRNKPQWFLPTSTEKPFENLHCPLTSFCSNS